MNISHSRVLVGTASVAAIGVGAFIYTASGHAATPRVAEAKPAPIVKKDPLVEARESLASQLQRRFHDRNDIDFGYGRVVREGARMHATAAAGRSPDEKSQQAYAKVWDQHQNETGWVDNRGGWHKGEYREMFLPENPTEEAVVASLGKGSGTAIYTVGLEDANHQPQRIKGPAYVSFDSPTAPSMYGPGATEVSANEVREKLMKASVALRDKPSAVVDGWRFVAYEIKADGKDCLKCHRSSDYPEPNKKASSLKVGDTIGRILIATKESSQVR